jgi:hypothetical protein
MTGLSSLSVQNNGEDRFSFRALDKATEPEELGYEDPDEWFLNEQRNIDNHSLCSTQDFPWSSASSSPDSDADKLETKKVKFQLPEKDVVVRSKSSIPARRGRYQRRNSVVIHKSRGIEALTELLKRGQVDQSLSQRSSSALSA